MKQIHSQTIYFLEHNILFHLVLNPFLKVNLLYILNPSLIYFQLMHSIHFQGYLLLAPTLIL